MIHLRVDDRLLHGQVTYGWCPGLVLDRIIVADDGAAGDEWQRETYEASGPDDVEVEVTTLEALAALDATGRLAGLELLVIVRAATDLERLIALGFPLREATIGELHQAEGRSERIAGYWATAEEAAAFNRMRKSGVSLTVRRLPDDEPVALPEFPE